MVGRTRLIFTGCISRTIKVTILAFVFKLRLSIGLRMIRSRCFLTPRKVHNDTETCGKFVDRCRMKYHVAFRTALQKDLRTCGRHVGIPVSVSKWCESAYCTFTSYESRFVA